MLVKQRVIALLIQINQEISQYLGNPAQDHELLHSNDLIKHAVTIIQYEKEHIPWGEAIDAKNNRLVICQNDRNDGELTAKRLLNIYQLRDQIDNQITSLDGPDTTITHDLLRAIIKTLITDIQTAIDNNLELDKAYKKHLRTFHQNRTSGMGIFSSWWHKTFTQSQSMIALESALMSAQQFAKELALHIDVNQSRPNENQSHTYSNKYA